MDKIANKFVIEMEDFFYDEHKIEPELLKGSLLEVYESLEQADKEKLLQIARILKI